MCYLLRRFEQSCVDCLKSLLGSHSRVWLGLREERKKAGHRALGLGKARDPVPAKNGEVTN